MIFSWTPNVQITMMNAHRDAALLHYCDTHFDSCNFVKCSTISCYVWKFLHFWTWLPMFSNPNMDQIRFWLYSEFKANQTERHDDFFHLATIHWKTNEFWLFCSIVCSTLFSICIYLFEIEVYCENIWLDSAISQMQLIFHFIVKHIKRNCWLLTKWMHQKCILPGN